MAFENRTAATENMLTLKRYNKPPNEQTIPAGQQV